MASLMPNGKQSYQDNNGNPLAGGRIYTYAAGTSTPLSTYSDAAGVTPNTNPTLLNARGEASIWWGDAPYKIVVKDASDVEIYTQDNAQAPMGRADLASTDSGKGAALVGFDGGTLADFMKSKSSRVVDSIAALKEIDKTKFTHAYASGYYAAGDGGGGAYWYDSADTTSADNGGTVIVAADGGRWKLGQTDTISIKQFGARGDGVADDSAAIQAAITASYGKTLYSPAGTFLLETVTSGALLTITNRIRIVADFGSAWVYGAGVSNTVDVIKVSPSTLADEGVEIDGLWIHEESGSPARDVIRIVLDADHGLKKLRIDRCLFRSKNGRAINCLNAGELNTNGLFFTQITKSEISGGVTLEGLGDSNEISDCAFTGPGVGIAVTMLSPSAGMGTSAKLGIRRNNITSAGGAIVINRGRNITIEDNNIEQLSDLSGGACVQLGLVDWDVPGASVVRGNKIEPADPVSQCNGLSLYRCRNVLIEGNHIGTSAKPTSYTIAVALTECNLIRLAGNHLYLSDACVGLQADALTKNLGYAPGALSSFNGNYEEVSDSSIGGMGVEKSPVLQNGWSNAAGLKSAKYRKGADRRVHLEGVLASGTLTADTVLFTLPAGFRPVEREIFETYVFTAGGVTGRGLVRVDSDGSVRIRYTSEGAAALLEYSISGVSFYAPDAV